MNWKQKSIDIYACRTARFTVFSVDRAVLYCQGCLTGIKIVAEKGESP